MTLGFWSVANAYVIRALPRELESGGLGTLKLLYLTLASVSPSFLGLSAEVRGFDLVFYTLAVVVAIGVLLSVWFRLLNEQRRRANSEKYLGCPGGTE